MRLGWESLERHTLILLVRFFRKVCMTRHINEDEVKGVRRDRSRRRFIVAYPMEKRREFIYVCKFCYLIQFV